VNRILVFCFCVFMPFALAPQSVFAQGETSDSAPSAEDVKRSELVEAQEDALREKVSRTIRKLDQREMTHFLAMFTNYNVFSIVKAVQDDIQDAVNRCADNNKDMATDVRGKYTAWNDNVGDVMQEADANIKNMSLAQNYISQAELNIIFGLVDEVRAVNSSRFESTPVTTPEACEFMMSKMDETQENMQQMLKVSLQSYPNLLKKTQE